MFKYELEIIRSIDDFKHRCSRSWERLCIKATRKLTEQDLQTLYSRYANYLHSENILMFLLLRTLLIFVVVIILSAIFNNRFTVEVWFYSSITLWFLWLIDLILKYVKAQIISKSIKLRNLNSIFIFRY